MKRTIDNIGDDLVTVVAIVGIACLGFHGITDPFIITAITGLGGYRISKRRVSTNQNKS